KGPNCTVFKLGQFFLYKATPSSSLNEKKKKQTNKQTKGLLDKDEEEETKYDHHIKTFFVTYFVTLFESWL
ncbi:hypothetical protein ACMBCM_10100, partial [Spiroplasma sp. K1]